MMFRVKLLEDVYFGNHAARAGDEYLVRFGEFAHSFVTNDGGLAGSMTISPIPSGDVGVGLHVGSPSVDQANRGKEHGHCLVNRSDDIY